MANGCDQISYQVLDLHEGEVFVVLYRVIDI